LIDNHLKVRLTFAVIATLTILSSPRVPGGTAAQQLPASASLPNFSYTVVHTYPHDPLAFTQGLQYVDGFLYEGTGQNGQSSIRKVKLESGEVVQRRDIAAEYFGEGITVWKSELVQLTWKSGVAFVYDRQTFKPRRTFRYSGEGWGLTEDGVGLIMSDGTDTLRFLDPETFAERRRLRVTALGQSLRNLNELEFVKGEIFANVWMTDRVARIDPNGGRVTGWIDLRGLLTNRERASADVLNGIAYDSSGDRLFVTGKWWPKLFEIKLQRKS
jgi:glutaminyl-peptide cyclotransferase